MVDVGLCVLFFDVCCVVDCVVCGGCDCDGCVVLYVVLF